MVLMEPFYIGTDTETDSWWAKVLQVLDEYRAIMRQLADAFGVIFVPLPTYFRNSCTTAPSTCFAPNPSIPTPSVIYSSPMHS